jgi:hypothetical protein
MEDLNFEIGDILSPEEAAEMYRDQEVQEPEENKEPAEEKDNSAEEEGQDQTPEKVGEEENNDDGKNAIDPEGDGASPNAYSSIAKALREDGILTGFDEKELEEVKTPEDFAELIDKFVESKVDEQTRRVTELMRNGVAPNEIQKYESNLDHIYLSRSSCSTKDLALSLYLCVYLETRPTTRKNYLL